MFKSKSSLTKFPLVRWFPDKKGTVVGIINAGYGISSTVWSQIQLAIANPNNVEAVEDVEGGDAFFEDEDVLNRVPTLIYTMAGIYAICLSIGKEYVGIRCA